MPNDYFRGDQRTGITAPNLAKPCSFPDHIVHARGKRTALTSVSLDRNSIAAFGESDYLLLHAELTPDGHVLTEHAALVQSLRESALSTDKGERAKSIHALRYARLRREGVVSWNFDVTSIPSKDLITWAFTRVQKYFRKL